MDYERIEVVIPIKNREMTKVDSGSALKDV